MNDLVVAYVTYEHLSDALAIELSRETTISVRAWLLLARAFQATRPVAATPPPIVRVTR